MKHAQSLQSLIEDVLRDYPQLTVETIEKDTIRILRRHEDAGHGNSEDIVGNYSEEAYEEGSLTERDIRDDCEEFYKLS